MDTSRGILYAASGRQHSAEAIVSARSAQKAMPEVPRILFTDKAEYGDDCFDEVRIIEEPHYSYKDKILPLKLTPFELTVFLDSDTYVAAPFPEVFDILDRFELAAAHHPWRLGPDADCPDAFTDLNTGMIAYQKSERINTFIDEWLAEHEALIKIRSNAGDQSTFRKVVYRTRDLQFYALTMEYNFTVYGPNFAGARMPVKILHGRDIDWEDLAARLNKSDSYRFFLPALNQLNEETVVFYNKAGTTLEKAIQPIVKLARKVRGK